jgi:hypothetical protein
LEWVRGRVGERSGQQKDWIVASEEKKYGAALHKLGIDIYWKGSRSFVQQFQQRAKEALGEERDFDHYDHYVGEEDCRLAPDLIPAVCAATPSHILLSQSQPISTVHKLLVANRGEIALRIICTAKAEGILTYALYNSSDVLSSHVALADEVLFLALQSTKATESTAYLSSTCILALCHAHQATLLPEGMDVCPRMLCSLKRASTRPSPGSVPTPAL